jgi:putative modified peptide
MARPRRRGDGPVMLSVHMSKTGAQAFLRKLSRDDAFRREFQRDPAGTLEQAGVLIPSDALPARPRLPSKEALRQFVRTGELAVETGAEIRPFAPCLVTAVLYAIAAQAK